MKVLVMVKGDPDPTDVDPAKMEAMLVSMGRYNEQLVEAGIMLDGAGLRNSRHGRRIAFEGGSTTVVDGPFGETKELLAGFWVWQVKDLDEAVEWARKAPFADGDTLELRQYEEPEDFGEGLTAEVQEREEQLRQQLAAQQSGS